LQWVLAKIKYKITVQNLLKGNINRLPFLFGFTRNSLYNYTYNNTVIFPIYLDTAAQSNSHERQAYRTVQRTLNMLAVESGQMYYAKKLVI
jgi:hypothetical protein